MGMMSVTGIVVKEVKVGDYDKILTVLSPEAGKLQLSAKGVRSLKNKNSAGCQILAYSSFELKEGKEIHSLVQCDLKENFYDLRRDVYRLSVGCYMGEVANTVARVGEPCPDLVKLLLNALFFLQKETSSPEGLKAVFELRVLKEEGLAPVTDACVFCGEEKNLRWFDPVEGCAVCEGCKESHLLPTDDQTLQAMGVITNGTLKEALTYPISPKAAENMGTLSEKMILAHVAPGFRSLDYIKSIK